MKNVLLPTDLTVQSLSAIHSVVRDANNQKVVIRLIHLLNPPTSITDLLFVGYSKPFDAVSNNFIEAYQMLQYKYKGLIEKISFDFLYCNTSRYLNNYIEGQDIDVVYLLDNFSYARPLQQSEKVESIVTKCKAPLVKAHLNSSLLSEYQTISSLLGGDKIEPTPAAHANKSALSYY